MMPVEVIVATARRPALLRVALESVAAQMRDLPISRVVVSENGDDDGSRAVALEFEGRMPIRYLRQNPCLSPLEHLVYLFENSQAEAVAFLCDDDWWFDGHLFRSLKELEALPDASAVFASAFFTDGERGVNGRIYRPQPLVLCGDKRPPIDPWHLSKDEVHAASWLVTPFHFSTMVCRRLSLLKAVQRIKGAHFFNIDRLLEVSLSREGPVVFIPQPSAGIRIHAQNWGVDRRLQELRNSDREAVRQIERSGAEFGFIPSSFWKKRLLRLAKGECLELAGFLQANFGMSGIRDAGFEALLFSGGIRGVKEKWIVRHGGKIKKMFPPLLLDWGRRFQ